VSHLFLTGFMGAGKSTVGRIVASRLDRDLVDLDAAIEAREGATVAEIFSARGEDGFREAEHRALEALVAAPSAVVATGGGVVLREDNQGLLKRHGTVVYLSVTPEEAMARLGDAGDRPLLAGGGLAAARSILTARLALYRATADHVVDTGGRTPAEVAEAVLAAIGSPESMRVIEVGTTGAETYEVVLGGGLLDELGWRVRSVAPASSVAVVSDETVWSLYGSRALASLEAAGCAVSVHTVPAGEASKSWETAGRTLESLAAAGLDRGSLVVALGGGVVGDLAGFCAATFMRGVALVQVPSTLLAQVDSAIGGKTGVDLAAGKNLAGAFWPPRLVLADTDLLATLPDIEWTNGLVEVAKAALLAGGEALFELEGDLDTIALRDRAAVTRAISRAVAFKAAVVTGDLREADVRECLNLGHTLGHALELLTGYGTISHGLAVAEGMRFAAQLAEDAGISEAPLSERTNAMLERIGAGADVSGAALAAHAATLTPAAILAAMKADKKSRGGLVRFVLLDAPGSWRAVGVEDVQLLDQLERWAVGLQEGRG